MTDNDEETKEHPVYPDAPPPGEPIQGDLVPPAPVPAEPVSAEPVSAEPAPAQPALVAPMTVDPLEPTTTIDVAPPAAPAYPQPPNQGWQGPPTGAANLPGQWQPTNYGQPGYGAPPPYPVAQPYGATAPRYGTSVLVALAAVLLVIMGVVLAVIGAWLLTQGPALNDLVQRLRSVDLVVFKPTRDQLRSVASASPGSLMVLGVLQLLIGAFVLGHRGWARWLGVVLALVGLLLSIVAVTSTMALIPGVSVQLIIAAAFLVAYAFVVLVLMVGGGHFRARYPGR